MVSDGVKTRSREIYPERGTETEWNLEDDIRNGEKRHKTRSKGKYYERRKTGIRRAKEEIDEVSC